jgi:hypothetical protein
VIDDVRNKTEPLDVSEVGESRCGANGIDTASKAIGEVASLQDCCRNFVDSIAALKDRYPLVRPLARQIRSGSTFQRLLANQSPNRSKTVVVSSATTRIAGEAG